MPCWAIQPVDPLGRPGSITRSQCNPSAPVKAPITGTVVGSPVIGPRAGKSPVCGDAGFGLLTYAVCGAQRGELLSRRDAGRHAGRCAGGAARRRRASSRPQRARQPSAANGGVGRGAGTGGRVLIR